jgi:FkbM family methyltransferase
MTLRNQYRLALGRFADTNIRRLAQLLPASRILYRFSHHYLARYNNDNNIDMASNGEAHWLQSVLGHCRVVFDVGANVGDWTEKALHINPHLQLHCFEPSRATFERLRRRPFVGQQVRANHAGLGAVAGKMTLHVYDEGGGTNSLYDRPVVATQGATLEEVVIDTLDNYCAANDIGQIDLLKMDVEGNELEVLKGAGRLLAHGAIARIQFEYGGTYIDAHILLKDMFELLQGYGYQLYKMYPDKLQHISRYHPSMENFQYQNWVAMKGSQEH